jgi:drug/metabolite transporter (DMT)-like permease
MNLSSNGKGILLATSGIVFLSPDSLLIRLVDTDLLTLTFLRSIFIGLSLLLLLFTIYRKHTIEQFTSLDRPALLIALSLAIGNIFFVAAIQTTSVAHTLIIVGAAPVFAAILALLFIAERSSMKTWVTIVVVLGCLVFVVYDGTRSSVKGDLYALVACVLWSANFVLARVSRVTNMMPAMALSGFINAVWAVFPAQLAALTLEQWGYSLLLGTFVGLALSQITLAPRFIPAAEVALFMPLETVLGTFLVWWLLDEYPGMVSIVGGAIIIAAIMLHSYLQLKHSRR